MSTIVTRCRRRALLLAAPALLALPRLARAQGGGGFPNRAVRLIVPYTPGGVSDITARLIAESQAANAARERP